VISVPPGKQRVVLAALLLSAGRVLSLDELAEALWAGAGGPPASARVTTQNYVKRLRHQLADLRHERIETRRDGYLMTVDPGEFDVARFEALIRRADQAATVGSWPRADDDLRAALSLWRGRPLADVPSEDLVLRESPRLEELHLQAQEAHLDVSLHLGRHREVIAEAEWLTARQPLREKVHALLILSLYRDGRQGDALAAYRSVRSLLIAELGVEPGPQLQELHHRILAADPALQASGTAQITGSPTGPVVPRQLPAVTQHFVGRQEHLVALSGLAERTSRTDGAAVVAAISGTAGVGKTALALFWAHKEAGRFPDGQLYVNLRGFDPHSAPVTPDRVLRTLLSGLGVPPGSLQPGLESQAGLYRSLLADQRMLIVLDNARNADQVRPLLPGGPGCLVLVTSRTQLNGLTATAGALPVILDVLTGPEARDLLDRHLPSRVAAEPECADELAGMCARLPLALAIVAARAAARPQVPLAVLVAGLHKAQDRLSVLTAGDSATDVRAIFSYSYRNMSAPTARLFRLLGLHCGPDISAPAAASLAGVPLSQTEEMLNELTGAHLLAEHVLGRYAFHDLLRAYARGQTRKIDTEAERSAALRRVLDHYLHSAYAAALMLNPTRDPVVLATQTAGAASEIMPDSVGALAWFEAEHHVLLAAVEQASDAGFDTHAWQIPLVLTNFLDWRGHWHDWAATQRSALAAAQRVGERTGQAHAHHNLGYAYARLRVYDNARGHLIEALGLYQEIGHVVGQARVQHILCMALSRQSHYREALKHGLRALELYRAVEHARGMAGALNALGWCHAELHNSDEAIAYCRQALTIHRELGDRHGQATTLDTLGYASHHLGQYDQANFFFRQALELCDEGGDRDARAEILIHFGDVEHEAGHIEGAVHAWQKALDILEEMHLPDADLVRAKLKKTKAVGS
jgi:DNA-binding SARP family transcriptional activator/tetratricopeptide (TPR) repeat protein